VVWVCENNQYAADTPVGAGLAPRNVADLAAGYDMPGYVVDGNDVLAVSKPPSRPSAAPGLARGQRCWSARPAPPRSRLAQRHAAGAAFRADQIAHWQAARSDPRLRKVPGLNAAIFNGRKMADIGLS